MSKALDFNLIKDRAGNLRETVTDRFLADSTYFKTGLGSATASSAAVTGETGYHLVVDKAVVCLASVAANSAVLVTLSDGTTSWSLGTVSTNGVYTLIDDEMSKFSVKGASGGTMTLSASSGGAASTVTLQLACHKVKAADV